MNRKDLIFIKGGYELEQFELLVGALVNYSSDFK
jgi:hypothetical protein